MTAPTGGQFCVTGLVLQMLVGLERGVTVVIDRTGQAGPALVAVTMRLEPPSGGDQITETPTLRLVEQVKIRTNGKPWTAGEIAGEVLPDLLKAVRDVEDRPTRHRLVTDGSLNCGELVKLAARLRKRELPDDALAALDDDQGKAFKYGAWMSERGYFRALMQRAGATDPARFWRLLAGLEIEGELTQQYLTARIDAVLGEIVDAEEDVPARRHELLNRMADLAQHGGSITAASLLELAGLPVSRLLHARRLPQLVQERLERDLATLGYEARHDVRETPRHAGRDLLLISGESGLGKSWRLAALLAARGAEGRLGLLVTNAASLEDVRGQIIERIWLSGFDRTLDLPGLQRRLGARFVDATGAWLTVGIDDVQDRALLAAIHTADWARYGIRVVVAVPIQLAEELTARPSPPADLRVERFSTAQLRRYLESHGKALRDLPADVVELLCTPIFADLYRRVADQQWRPTGEYELVNGFWHHATYQTRGMADAQDAVVALERAARGLLEPQRRYPWPVEDALAHGLDQQARKQLIATGVLRASETGVAMTHDRVLNWLVARALVADLRAGRRDAAATIALLMRFDTAGAIAPGLAYRLGYVLLDLLWLAAGDLNPAIVRDLITGVLAAPEYRINAGHFIEDQLAGLGVRIVPVLELIARIPETDHSPNAMHAARAIAAVAADHPGCADSIVTSLISEGQDEQAVRAGLVIAGKVAVPASIDRIWSIHLERRQAVAALPDAADVHLRHDLSDRSRTSYRALKRAATGQSEWIEQRIAGTNDRLAAELLLEQLMEIDHGPAEAVWRRTKARLFAAIPAGRRILASAIGHFGDAEEAGRLEQATENEEYLESTRRFDALLGVAPVRAVAQIDVVPYDLLHRAWYNVRRLVRSGGPAGQTRLRARHGSDWEAMRDLALVYYHEPDLIDPESFMAIIAALETRLAEVAGTAWQQRGEGHLFRCIAEARRPDLLAILESQRGSRFERLLTDHAIGREARNSLCVDRDGEHLERLLLAIGGEGYGELVASGIGQATIFAREDGYEAALRLPPGSPHAAGLAAAVDVPGRDRRENYDLMVALAVHRMDAPLYDLIMVSQAAYDDAFDIRATLGPWSPDIEARIRADLASPEGTVRIGAACALPFAPPDDAAELLADTLTRCPDDDPSALTAVRIANALRLYSPRSLPQLRRMLILPDPKAREAVLPYLAVAGDAEARSVVTAIFEAEAPPVLDHASLNAAFAVSAHEPAGGSATRRLALFLDRRHGMYPVGRIAVRLHDNRALGNEELVELAYTAQRISAETSVLLIERIAQFDRDEAYAIAERHFEHTPSAGVARQILVLGGEAGLDHLVEAFLGEQRERARLIIARALRRHAERASVVERLEALASNGSVERRIAAAELFGWIPGTAVDAALTTLAASTVPEIADAVLHAQGRREAHDHAGTLLAEMPDVDHLGRWSRLQAVVDLADPYLLESDLDGLALGLAADAFGEAFAIGAECVIKKRKDALEKEADRIDRDRRDRA